MLTNRCASQEGSTCSIHKIKANEFKHLNPLVMQCQAVYTLEAIGPTLQQETKESESHSATLSQYGRNKSW